MTSFGETSGSRPLDMYDAPHLFAQHTEIDPHTDGRRAFVTFLTAHELAVRPVDHMSPYDTEAAMTVFGQTIGMYSTLYQKWLGQNIEDDTAVEFVLDESCELAEEFAKTCSTTPERAGLRVGDSDPLTLFSRRYMARQPPIDRMTQRQRFRALTVFEAFGYVVQPQFDACLKRHDGSAAELIRRMSTTYASGVMYLSGIGLPASKTMLNMVQAARSEAEEFMRGMGIQ